MQVAWLLVCMLFVPWAGNASDNGVHGVPVGFSNSYVFQKDALKIGYVEFIAADDHIRRQVLQNVRKTFETTLIEESQVAQSTSHVGVRYYFGLQGKPIFLVYFFQPDLRFQEHASKSLAQALNLDFVFRGEKLVSYWTPSQKEVDLSSEKNFPLNVFVGTNGVSFSGIGEDWKVFQNVQGLKGLSRGAPGEIIYSSYTPSRESLKGAKFWYFVKGESVAKVAVPESGAPPFGSMVLKSDAQCAMADVSLHLLFCQGLSDGGAQIASYETVLGKKGSVNSLVMSFPTGRLRMKMVKAMPRSSFERLLQVARPTLATDGESFETIHRMYQNGVDVQGSHSPNDPVNSQKQESFQLKLVNSSGEVIADAEFEGMTPIERAKVVQFITETIEPKEYQLISRKRTIGSDRNPAQIKSEDSLVGLYNQVDQSWLERNRLRYFNKDFATLRLGFNRFDYETKGSGNLLALTRQATSVSAFIDGGGDWWITRSFWGLHASGRFAQLSHNVNGTERSGDIYFYQVGPRMRYFLSQSPLSPSLELFLGFGQDVDRVESNSLLESAEFNLLPLEIKGRVFWGNHYSSSALIRRSFVTGGTSNTSRAQGTIDRLEADLSFRHSDLTFDLRLALQYQVADIELSGGQADRTEFGGSFGIEMRWE